MKFSESWLREIIDIKLNSSELSHKLTMLGHEVNSVITDGSDIDGIVIAEIVNYAKHPNADRLSLCEINYGKNNNINVICGAPNVRTGLKTALAKVGQALPDGTKIKKSKIRGIESNGMLCSAAEISLGMDQDGIIELPIDAPVGLKLNEYLNLPDNIFDLDLTPNRGDCFSVLGVARDLASSPQSKLHTKKYKKAPITSKICQTIKTPIPEICPRFASQSIKNVNNTVKTPIAITEKLRKSGIRSINPIVDVTNYVMMVTGQPLHAYDQSKIKGIVQPRFAKKDERIMLLDEQIIKLEKDTIVVSDSSGAIGLAGIMGGLSTAVNFGTTEVLFEAAYWPPEFMAGKARKYHMHTDASLRFERGVDPNIQSIAVNMATNLLLSICNGDAGPLMDIKNKKFLPKEITIKLNEIRVNKILGHIIPKNKITKILKSLNFEVTEAKTSWNVTVPTYRFDVKIEDDLIEEIARVYGFGNIPGATEESNNPLNKSIDDRLEINNISNHLCSRDYQEIISYSFVEEQIDNFISGKNSSLKLKNPISSEMSVMRSSLLSGLLNSLKRNISRQNSRVRLFEVGKVFNGELNNHDEREKIAAISLGTIDEENWRANNDCIDFYNVKGDLESIIGSSHENHLYSFKKSDNHIFQPGQAAEVFKEGNSIGCLGKLHPNLLKLFNIKQDVFYFEIDYELCFTPFIVNAHTISKYPQIRRDISITIDKSVAVSEIINSVIQINPNIIQSTNVFDVYEGKNIEEGRKSIALGLILQDKSRTLIDKDADDLVELVIKSLQSEYSAQLRE